MHLGSVGMGFDNPVFPLASRFLKSNVALPVERAVVSLGFFLLFNGF